MGQNISTGTTQANISISGALEQKQAKPLRSVMFVSGATTNVTITTPANKVWLILSMIGRPSAAITIDVTTAAGSAARISSGSSDYVLRPYTMFPFMMEAGDKIEFVRTNTADNLIVTYYEYDA